MYYTQLNWNSIFLAVTVEDNMLSTSNRCFLISFQVSVAAVFAASLVSAMTAIAISITNRFSLIYFQVSAAATRDYWNSARKRYD